MRTIPPQRWDLAPLFTLSAMGCPSVDKELPARDSEDTGECLSPTVWYADADGDGFGDANSTVSACNAPDGTVADSTDCDDANSTVYPGAPEVCIDGVYNDCDDVDGTAAMAACDGEDPYSLTYSDTTFVGEREGDLAGVAVAGAGDVDRDGHDDLLIGAPNVDPGKAYLVAGPVTGIVSLAYADTTFNGGEGWGGEGWSLDGAGDLDGDGFADVLIGAPGTDITPTNGGAAYLFLSPTTGAIGVDSADATFIGEADADNAGISVAGLGDVNGDGWDDLLIGAHGAQGVRVESSAGDCAVGDLDEYGSELGAHAGAAYLVQGPVAGTLGLGEADALIYGEDGGDAAGHVVASPGDYNGDGAPDLLIGAPGNCEGGIVSGAGYLVNSPTGGEVYLGDADLKLVGEQEYDFASVALAGAGDINGDGAPDLAIGAPNKDGRYGSLQGRAYLVFGPVSGRVDLGSADATIEGEAVGDQVSYALSSAGDLDADGTDDLILSAPWDETAGVYAGAVYVMYGPREGHLSLRGAGVKLLGVAAGDHAGYALAGVGDVDADGASDILIGTLDGDEAGGSGPGLAYLVLGSSPMLNGTFGP